MNSDMEHVRALGEALKPPADAPPLALRGRVLAGLASVPQRTRPRARPWTWAALVGSAVAAAALVVVAVDPAIVRPPGQDARGEQNPVRLLEFAADRVGAQAGPVVRGDQFIYTESVALLREARESGQGNYTAVEELRLVRLWLSVDGTRDGLIQVRPAGAGDAAAWESQVIAACTKGHGCTLTPGQATELPTDAEGMHRYLYRPDADEFSEVRMGPDERALNRAGSVLRAAQQAPAVQAAVFAAMSRIPKVRVRPGVSNLVDRQGVAIAYSGDYTQTELVFDPDTYRYLGVNRTQAWLAVARGPETLWLNYQLALREAITSVAVVDEVGTV